MLNKKRVYWAVGGCIVLALAAAIVLLSNIETAKTEVVRVGGNWEVDKVTSALPEAGGHHTFLYRATSSGRRLVAKETWKYRYLGDDCIVYFVGGYHIEAACGDRAPVVIGYPDEHGDADLDGDPLRLHGKEVAVAEAKRRARGE